MTQLVANKARCKKKQEEGAAGNDNAATTNASANVTQAPNGNGNSASSMAKQNVSFATVVQGAYPLQIDLELSEGIDI